MKRTWSQLLIDVLQHADQHLADQEYACDHYGETTTKWDRWCSWWQGAATGFFNDNRWIPLWWRITGRDFTEVAYEPYICGNCGSDFDWLPIKSDGSELCSEKCRRKWEVFFNHPDNEDSMTKANIPAGWESVGTDHEDSHPVPKGWAVAETDHEDSHNEPLDRDAKPSA